MCRISIAQMTSKQTFVKSDVRKYTGRGKDGGLTSPNRKTLRVLTTLLEERGSVTSSKVRVNRSFRTI